MIIGFSTTNKVFSRVIRWATGSKASHTYLLVKVAGEPIVIHSTQQGVNCDHYKKFKKSKNIVTEYKLLIPEETEKIVLSAALKLLDRPYDFPSIIGFGWVLLNKAFGRKTKNPFPNRSAYQCSEFGLEMLKTAGINGLEDFDRELVSPEDLIDFLDKCKKVKEI